MKSVHCCLILIVLLLSGINYNTIAQTEWYKHPGKFDILKGNEGEWDEFIFDFDISFENDEYLMCYEAWQFDEPGRGKFGFASSLDGIHWEKLHDDPLDFNNKNFDWVTQYWTFDVIRKDSMYLMWFAAETKDPSCPYGIGFAWSTDGITWNAHPEPVLKPGKEDSWDGHGVTNPNVIFDGKIYHMWYAGFPNSIPKVISMGYATSTDGIHWIKHQNNPVLKHGKPGSWDDHWVVGYSITTNGPIKEMWYFGFNQIKFEIGLATSEDGVLWTKSPENPVLKAGKLGEWDANAHSPRVIRHDSIYRMWYGVRGGVGYATSSLAEFKSWEKENIAVPQRIIWVRVFNRMDFINVDSLLLLLPELSDTTLIDAYNKLALAYSLNDYVKSYHYAEKALVLADLEDYPVGRAMALYAMGNSQYVMNNYTDALVNQLTALRIFDSLNMQFEAGNLLSQIASIHTYAGSYDLACKYYQQALNVFIQLQDTVFIINALNYLGESFLDAEDTLQARRTFEKVLVMADRSRQTNSYAFALEGLGKSYQGHLLDSSIYYILEARNVWVNEFFWKEASNSLLLAEIYLAAGPEYYSEANAYLQESFTLLKQDIGDSDLQLNWLYKMAELKISTGRYIEGKEYLDLTLSLCKTFLLKHNDQVYESLNEKLEFGILLREYMEKIYRLYYKLDISLKDKSAELKHFMLATAWKDSVSNEQAWKKVAMIQADHEMEINKSQISILEKENEVQNLTLKKSKIYLYGLSALVLLVILGAIVFIRQRRIRAQYTLELERVKSERLKELDQLKSRFFANISHEFRTPLTLIMGPLDKVLSRSEDKNDKKELSIAKKYAGKLQIQINNLLTISKLESNKLQLLTSETDIVKLTRSYLQAFESLAKDKNIDLRFSSEKEVINAFIDREKFEQILNNLLSNAFKFTNDGGIIEVTISNKSKIENRKPKIDNVLISFSDTGPGIPPEHIDHVFDRFYQVNNDETSYYEGSGIGLALTKELVELHHGKISVSSERGAGSRFEVLLPLGEEHLNPEEIKVERGEAEGHPAKGGEKSEQRELKSESEIIEPLSTANWNEAGPSDIPPEAGQQLSTDNSIESDPNKPILLIVEDNSDMRSYIRGYFEKEFQIIEAVDGKDGYEKSIENIPDIIISDVMMPIMDGNELCRRVKKDERTSHIPVILLTARASKESRIEGLETGVDDFITKPFDGDELQVRVKNLINQRKQIRVILERKISKSHTSKVLNFEDSGITSMDESFLQKVFKILREQHSDPQFNADKFARAIGLSRVQVNRKIKALTGYTTGELIRVYRLTRGAELIKNESATIAEIAYDVGFNSPSYFTECFRKQFGQSPSEFNGNSN